MVLRRIGSDESSMSLGVVKEEVLRALEVMADNGGR
jgi:hypothetical protein